MKQYPVELHSHTNHSDGDFEAHELIEEAVTFGYKGLILTDHNTTSSAEEVIEQGLDSKITFLKGIEWTTYFGHMLVHDAKRVVDWREAKIDTIDTHIKEVKEEDGLVGIAHPFAIGSPICTGCHWEFQIEDWTQVNYIEIWNSTNPHLQFWSEEAYKLWVKRLKQGYRISASAGRDWHRMEKEGFLPGVTYVQTEKAFTPEMFKECLRKGAMYITLAPRLAVTLSDGEHHFSYGDRVSANQYTVSLTLSESDIDALRSLDIEPQKIVVIRNEEIAREFSVEKYGEVQSFTLNASAGYLRFEVIGRYGKKENVRLTLSSPIYVK